MPPRRRRDDDEEDGDFGDESAPSAGAAQDVNSIAAQIVRLALFGEYRHVPLKRADIKALIPGKLPFDHVLARAQQILANTFGMELVELRLRLKGDAADERENARTETQAQTQATQRRKGKRKAREDDDEDDEEEYEEDEEAPAEGTQRRTRKKAGAKVYILRNILPPGIVAAMSVPNALPAFDAEDEAYTEALEADSGALIPWEKADGNTSVEMLGIRTVILCLILSMGRSAEEYKLYGLLRRIGLQKDTVLPYNTTDSNKPFMTLEKYIDVLAKQNYLEKMKRSNPSAPEGFSYELRWGSREAEFSEEAALAFIERLFLNEDDEGPDSDNSDFEAPPRNGNRVRTEAEKRKRFERKRKQLREDLERAAGGKLAGQL